MIIEEQLKMQKDFSDVEKIIANYILERGEQIKHDSARYIAGQVYTAPSSVTRLCQRLGFEGYPAFREAYLKEIAYLCSHFQRIDANHPFERKDGPIRVANKISALYGEIIDDTLSLITVEQMQTVVKIFETCRIIHVVSLGAHGHLAYPFREKMMKIGIQVDINQFSDIAYYQANVAKKDEVFLFISYSGELENVIKVADKAKQRGIPTICFTSFGHNCLSEVCDITFYVSTREKLITNVGTYGVYVSVLYLFDVLYSCLFNRNHQKNLSKKIEISTEYEQRRSSRNPILMEWKEKNFE